MGSSSQTVQNNEPYEAARPLIDQGLRDAQSMYEAGGFNISPYEGDLVAGRTPFQQMAAAGAPGAVYGAMGAGGAAQQAAMRAMDPYASEAVKARVIEDIMPGINSTFANSGMFGSSLHAQNLAKGLSSGLANVEDMAQARALQAAGIVPGLNQAQFGALNYLEDVGGRQQAQAQAEIEADVFQDQQRKTAELAALQDYLALSSGAGSMFGVQSSRTRQNPGALGLLGFGLQALSLF